ncbi:MAG: hypothetical protein ACOZBH_04945 [Patescibacteria group bacterium]
MLIFKDMREYSLNLPRQSRVLCLGAESAGNFTVYENGQAYFFSDFGDLLDDKNFNAYQEALFGFFGKRNFVPDVITVDLHPDFKTSKLGMELAQKFGCRLEKVQHHAAHIYSVLFDHIRASQTQTLPRNFVGIAGDGTGYGLDGKIWGGEVFLYRQEAIGQPSPHGLRLTGSRPEVRIGHLENQLLCGGDLAIKEPARMLLSILLGIKKPAELWPFFSAFYAEQQFNVLAKMREQKFNSVETSSTGRVLDAASLLLGFCGNKRAYKHEPIDLLEKNSTEPFILKPQIEKQDEYVLNTTWLFQWMLDNLDKDKGRLAATVQKYIIEGLIEIAGKVNPDLPIYFGGGMANNKIMSQIAEENGVIMAKNIERGDNSLSLGQLMYCLWCDKLS